MGRVLSVLGTALVGLLTAGCGFGAQPAPTAVPPPTATLSKPAMLLTPRPAPPPTAPPTPTAQLVVARLPIVTPGTPRPTAPPTPSVRGTPIRASEPLVGTLLDDHVQSAIIGQTFLYRVYLPPDYLHSPQRRYPVMYMLHGAGGNYTEWSDSYLPETADRMMVSGEIPPMIIVMPDDGEATYWANWSEDGPRWGDYVTEDLVAMVDQRYRTLARPQSRAVGGLSMGGLGALNLAFEHPEVFGVVGAHSPSVRLEPDPTLWFLVGQNFWDHNPAWLAKHRSGLESLDIWIDAGTDDVWLPNIEAVHSALVEQGIKSTWHVFPGPHEAEYWIEHVPDYLRFYGASVRT